MLYFQIYIVIIILGIIIGIIRYKQLTSSSRIFLLLLVITLIIELISQLGYKSLVNQSNYIVYHIFSPIQYGLIAFGYNTELKSKPIRYSIFLMSICAFIFSIWVQPIQQFNSYYINLNFFITILISIYYLRKLLEKNTEESFLNFPLFWISCGFLLFNIANLFVFGTFNSFFSKVSYIERVFAYIRIFTNYILYTLFIVAFLVKQHTLLDDERK
jgi:hypothetical protein